MAVISSGSVEMYLHKIDDWKNIYKYKKNSIIENLVNAGVNPYLLFINFKTVTPTTLKASTPHLTDTEVFPADSKLGLGGGTPVSVVLVSDDASDDGTVYVIGWGLDGSGNSTLIAEEMTLNGLTNVSSTRTFYDVFHMYALKSVTGNITLKYGGTTLLTITAGNIHSNGSGFTIPLGWQCIPTFVALNQEVVINRFYDTCWLCIKKIEEDSSGNANGIQETFWFAASILSPNTQQDNPFGGKVLNRHKDSNNNELRIEHHLGYQVNANPCEGIMVYVLWKQTITETLTS